MQEFLWNTLSSSHLLIEGELLGRRERALLHLSDIIKFLCKRLWQLTLAPTTRSPTLTRTRHSVLSDGLILSNLICKKKKKSIFVYLHVYFLTDKIAVLIYMLILAGVVLIRVFSSTWVFLFFLFSVY